jgi:hypothetical protein
MAEALSGGNPTVLIRLDRLLETKSETDGLEGFASEDQISRRVHLMV